ncbi:hypothetical protein B296_00052295 [Ensete ventricosum]|uniref:Uncharacterized protein n=1 Tax=Ensete ventricosum TaxID=4639 RepID=A0A426X2M4_ENSVE|nr:hypothetical protein B296_00052295 [Ensete ventricosum]
MWCSLRRWPTYSPRTASSLRTSGGRSGCSRAGDGCTTRSTTRSRTSCSSGGCSTTNSRVGGEEATGDREEMGCRSASLAVRCDIAGPISAK